MSKIYKIVYLLQKKKKKKKKSHFFRDEYILAVHG